VHTVDSLRDWYRLYFRRFRDFAPPRFCVFGYESGEPNGMAGSLESLVCFANRIPDPGVTILNAGAGASSWVLRKLFRRVICTDPDRAYLEFIRVLCGQHGLRTDGFVHALRKCRPADFTFYDYGHFDLRWPMLAAAWDRTRIAMYLDDTDDRPENTTNRASAIAFASELGLQLEDRRDAVDQYGRWGSFLYRNGVTPNP
jgi:hypothetical protein